MDRAPEMPLVNASHSFQPQLSFDLVESNATIAEGGDKNPPDVRTAPKGRKSIDNAPENRNSGTEDINGVKSEDGPCTISSDEVQGDLTYSIGLGDYLKLSDASFVSEGFLPMETWMRERKNDQPWNALESNEMIYEFATDWVEKDMKDHDSYSLFVECRSVQNRRA
jgi:hypothetical protein